MNRFIFADSNKCIGCRTCEVACVMAHGDGDIAQITQYQFSPRIHVVKGFSVSTAVVCRQCEDAPCATVCANAAITRKTDFIYVEQQKCIGCKTCVVACPYGTMEVVTKVMVSDDHALSGGLNTRAQANKCDLCHTRDVGPACVEVCPTKALVVMDRNAVDQMVQEKRRRAALDTSVSGSFLNF